MKMRTFIQLCNNAELDTKPLIIFTGQDYQVLFFATLLEQLRKRLDLAPKTLSVTDTSFAQLQAQLSTTFLGQKHTWWCGNISALDAATKKKLIPFLLAYKGPHAVLSFIALKDLPADADRRNVVNINDPLSPAERELLMGLLFDGLQWKHVLELTSESYKTMPLDTLVLLAQYRSVLGKNVQPFMQTWFEKIVAPDESLFTLSQWFFSRKPQHFYRTWHAVKDDYVPVFWTTFWSEQLWRAYYVIALRKQQRLNEAKQMAYRLPFSFLQRDWKNIKESELLLAHDFLTQADFSIKNGASELFLDVLYSRFFAKQF